MTQRRSLTILSLVVLATSLLIWLALEGVAIFKVDGEKGAGRIENLQRTLGILPDSLRFGACKIVPPNGTYLAARKRRLGGSIWVYGIIPSDTPVGTESNAPFYSFSDGTTINILEDQHIQGIRGGQQACLASGVCKAIPNVFGSGHMGLGLASRSPNMVMVPDLGISVTLPEPTPHWLRCVS